MGENLKWGKNVKELHYPKEHGEPLPLRHEKRNAEAVGTMGDMVGVYCPACDCEYTHLQGLVGIADRDDRRESVGLEFMCENGHKFMLVLEQWKGQTLQRYQK
jgi:hypothetical protein